jgi:hypothetical protein
MNRRIAFWSLTIVVMAALAGTSTVQAATYYVRAQGDDRKEGTTPQAAFRTVTRAAQALAQGGRIVIGPGKVMRPWFEARPRSPARVPRPVCRPCLSLEARRAFQARRFIFPGPTAGRKK